MNRRRSSNKARKNSFIVEAKRKFYRGIILFALSLLTIVFLFGDHGVYQLYKIKSQRKATQKRIEVLKTEREILENEKNRLETDLDYIERLAREKYRMAKNGEKIFKVIPKQTKK